jgi:hypothetical protein
MAVRVVNARNRRNTILIALNVRNRYFATPKLQRDYEIRYYEI